MDGLEKDTALLRELSRWSNDSAAAIAEKAKVAASTIQRPYSGRAETGLGPRTLDKLQVAYPDFPRWGESGDALAEESLDIPVLDLAYGMGGSYLDDDDGGQILMPFPKEFIRFFTDAPADRLYIARGMGDSMMPTIHDRDLLLIDRSQDALRMNDQVWALADGGIGMVKRLRVVGGDLQVMSDNPNVEAYSLDPDGVQLIGRVVARIGRM